MATKRPTYRLSGVSIESDIELSRARRHDREAVGKPPRDGGPADAVVRVELRPPSPVGPPVEWSEERCFPGSSSPWLSIARRGDGYLLRVHSVGDFEISGDGGLVACTPLPGGAPDILEQSFVDQVFPLVLHLRGRFSLHASGVTTARGVVGFMGVSGMGKSTLAATLTTDAAITDAFTGSKLVSDDCLTLHLSESEVLALPSYPASRLWVDSAERFSSTDRLVVDTVRTGKLRLDREGADASLPLVALFVLVADAEVRVEPLRGGDTVAALAAHLHRLDTADRRRLTDELALLASVAARVPVSRLVYPRSFDALGAVRAALAAALASPLGVNARLASG